MLNRIMFTLVILVLIISAFAVFKNKKSIIGNPFYSYTTDTITVNKIDTVFVNVMDTIPIPDVSKLTGIVVFGSDTVFVENGIVVNK